MSKISDLGCERPGPVLHHNQKLLKRRSRHNSSVRHNKQVELRGNKSVVEGGGGARARRPEGPRRQQTASGVQAAGGGEAGGELREPPQNVVLRDFPALWLQHQRILLRAGAYGAAPERNGTNLEDEQRWGTTCGARRSFSDPFRFSSLTSRAVLPNNSQEDEERLLHRHVTVTTVGEVAPEVLRADHNLQRLSEQHHQ